MVGLSNQWSAAEIRLKAPCIQEFAQTFPEKELCTDTDAGLVGKDLTMAVGREAHTHLATYLLKDWAGETVYWVKLLLREHEEPSADPQKPGQEVCIFNINAGGRGGQGPGHTTQPV